MGCFGSMIFFAKTHTDIVDTPSQHFKKQIKTILYIDQLNRICHMESGLPDKTMPHELKTLVTHCNAISSAQKQVL